MLKLVPASIEDAELITRIKTDAYDDEMERFGPDHDISEYWGPQWYSDPNESIRQITQYPCYKMVVDHIAIGCFWLREINSGVVELEDFCIAPKFQNRGYGYTALMEMEKLFQDKKKWVLGTPYYSVRNQHLYEKAGYVKIGESETKFAFLYE